MTLLVRNDADIIRQWLDFHLANGVDKILVTDHRSTDGTTEILQDYERKGKLQYAYESSAEYEQSVWVTAMARRAFLEHNADWVINADADEFYVPRHGTLKTVLNALPCDTDVITIRRNDMPPLAADQGRQPLQKMIYRKRVSRAWPMSHVIIDKVIHRGFPVVTVATGAHGASSSYFRMQRPCADIETLHYPIRSLEQFRDKVRLLAAAHIENVKTPGRYNLWREALERGELENMYGEVCLQPDMIDFLLKSGELSVDRRVEAFVSRPPDA